MAVIHPHQGGGGAVVGSRAEGGTQAGAGEQYLQAGDHGERGEEDEEREPADRDPLADGDARRLQRADLEPAGVSGKHLQQDVLNHDREVEGHQRRRQDVAPEGEVEDAALQRVAEARHRRHGDDQAQQRMKAGALNHGQAQERRQHDEIAVGDVDQPHHAEDQRKAGREQRVEPPSNTPWTMASSHSIAPHTPK